MKSGQRKSGVKLGMLVGLVGLAMSATAQMTTPPAEKPAGWPAETPSAPVNTQNETISVQEAIRRGLMADPAKQDQNGAQPGQPANATPAPNTTDPAQAKSAKEQMHTNYQQWERDGSGRVIKLDRPLHWAAIDRNTTISPQNRKKIEAFLEQRRIKIEEAILANMDKVRELDSGEIETFTMSKRENLGKVLAATNAFKPVGVFATELRKADLFSQANVQQHNTIVDDYRRLLLDDMKRDSGATGTEANGNMDLVSRAMFTTIADEPRQVYYWMLTDSADSAVDRIAVIGVSAEVEPKVRAAFQQAKDSKDESERLAKMREGVSFLTPEQTKALVEPVVKHAAANSAPATNAAQGSTPSNATSDASKAGDR